MERCTILSAYYNITLLICIYSITSVNTTVLSTISQPPPSRRLKVALESPHSLPLPSTPPPRVAYKSENILMTVSLPPRPPPPPDVSVNTTPMQSVTIHSPAPPPPKPMQSVTIYSPAPPSPTPMVSVTIDSHAAIPPPPPPQVAYKSENKSVTVSLPPIVALAPPPSSTLLPTRPLPSPPLPPPLHTSPPPSPLDFHPKKKKSKVHPTLIGAALVGGLVIIVSMITLILCFARKTTFFTKKETMDQNVEDLLQHRGKNAPARYTYADLKKMTSNLKQKLGEGGYAIVYQGELKNGRLVAVKVLKKSEDGKEFINEVAGIIGTNHVNIVTLIGFCFEGRIKALVYEFMPNGSLEKYMHGGENALEWGVLIQIAIGIARGLEYLHRGCNTRILHFDIKPQNILLDENFCPKIADFGLARPCLQKESLVTMSGARGTPGYIAPEVFCRGFGGASQKSDVYSYGMLVLDMVGCRKSNTGLNKKQTSSSELFFPQWIYKQFELEEEIELQGISTDEEKQIQRKMVIVSLWCIQTGPSSRPRMSKVIEMLEGSLDSLRVPPIPCLFSPPRSPDQNSPSTHSMTL